MVYLPIHLPQKSTKGRYIHHTYGTVCFWLVMNWTIFRSQTAYFWEGGRKKHRNDERRRTAHRDPCGRERHDCRVPFRHVAQLTHEGLSFVEVDGCMFFFFGRTSDTCWLGGGWIDLYFWGGCAFEEVTFEWNTVDGRNLGCRKAFK